MRLVLQPLRPGIILPLRGLRCSEVTGACADRLWRRHRWFGIRESWRALLIVRMGDALQLVAAVNTQEDPVSLKWTGYIVPYQSRKGWRVRGGCDAALGALDKLCRCVRGCELRGPACRCTV